MAVYILRLTCYAFIKGKKIFGTEILEKNYTHMYSNYLCASLMVFGVIMQKTECARILLLCVHFTAC